MHLFTKVRIGIIIAVLFIAFLVLTNSLPYSKTNVYRIAEQNEFGEIVISCITDDNMTMKIISDLSKDFNLSSREYNFSTKIRYHAGGLKDWKTEESFDDSYVLNFTAALLSDYRDDGLIDIMGNDIGFGIYDRDFFIYCSPEDANNVISTLESDGLQPQFYIIKSKYSHFHFDHGKAEGEPI